MVELEITFKPKERTWILMNSNICGSELKVFKIIMA